MSPSYTAEFSLALTTARKTPRRDGAEILLSSPAVGRVICVCLEEGLSRTASGSVTWAGPKDRRGRLESPCLGDGVWYDRDRDLAVGVRPEGCETALQRWCRSRATMTVGNREPSTAAGCPGPSVRWPRPWPRPEPPLQLSKSTLTSQRLC